MKRFLRVFKVLTLVVMTAMLAGCAGHLNLVERGYTPINSPNPEFVFIVEDKHFTSRIPRGIVSVEISSFTEVSEAINAVFKGRAVAVVRQAHYRSNEINDINIAGTNIVKITPVEYNMYNVRPSIYGHRSKFVADVSIGNNAERIDARGKIPTPLWWTDSDTERLSNKTFLAFAEILRERLIKGQ